MVNSNPETVSTDYDTSDKLYFEPLTKEDVLNIIETEKPMGIIVQFGGQTPLNLAEALARAGAPIIGTSQQSIAVAEDRELFRAVLQKLGLKQPESGTAMSIEDAIGVAEKIGYPVMVRPSYVLGGRAMKIAYDQTSLVEFTHIAKAASPDHPILIDKFLEDAIEVDVDGISDGRITVVAGIMGAYRRSRRSLRRQCLCAAAPYPVAVADRAHQGTDQSPGNGTQGDRTPEYPVCREGRRGLYSGSEPACLADGPLCEQGDRRVAGQAGHQGHAGAYA